MKATMIGENLMNVKSVSERTGLSDRMIYKLMKIGELPYHKIGKAVRIASRDVEALLKRTRVCVSA